VSASPFVRVNRAKLHALIERAADVIDSTVIDADLDLGLPRNDMEALWRQAGIATMIGLAIYEDAEAYVEHKVYGGELS
jgi:hypothetical protein